MSDLGNKIERGRPSSARFAEKAGARIVRELTYHAGEAAQRALARPDLIRCMTMSSFATSPNQSPHKPKSAEIMLASRLRQMRKEKHLTLEQLATSAGMSQAYLSRVENHKVSLTIAGLEQLAAALDVPMAVFFDDDDRNVPILHCLAGQGERRRFRGPNSFVFEMLAAAKKGKLMEPLIIDPQTARQPMPIQSHSGEEFNYVLSGECMLLYGDNQIRMRAGDSAYYDASVPHAAHAIKGRPCKLLAVVSSREYLFHGDLSRLLKGAS